MNKFAKIPKNVPALACKMCRHDDRIDMRGNRGSVCFIPENVSESSFQNHGQHYLQHILYAFLFRFRVTVVVLFFDPC